MKNRNVRNRKCLIISSDKQLREALERAFSFVLGYDCEQLEDVPEKEITSTEYEAIIIGYIERWEIGNLLGKLADKLKNFIPILILDIYFKQEIENDFFPPATGMIRICGSFRISTIHEEIKKVKEEFESYKAINGDELWWKINLKDAGILFHSHG